MVLSKAMVMSSAIESTWSPAGLVASKKRAGVRRGLIVDQYLSQSVLLQSGGGVRFGVDRKVGWEVEFCEDG